MKTPDFFAATHNHDIFSRDKNKPAYFKLVFIQKSPESIQVDRELFEVVGTFLQSQPMFDSMVHLDCENNLSFEIINGEYLNIVEFAVKCKSVNSWLGTNDFNTSMSNLYSGLDKLSLPNNWMFSHKFINYFNLNVQKKSCDDLDVNNIFEKSVSDPVDVKPETTEEKTKRLLEARREIHGCWSMLFMDGKLPSMDVNTLPEFKDLYGIDMQIKMMLTSIIAAYQTNGKRKAHTVLFGPAGCGKTTVLDKLDDLLGKENVVRLDAPCMTKSGLETLLLEMKHIPAVIIIEEIEKCSENNLRTLLGIMDERSEICKTTVSGSVTRSVNSLIFATVNDIEKFNKYLDGALSSRFKNKVFFPRPSEQTLNMILERDISKNGGKKEWVKPVLDFAKELNVTDPRMILSWLINGDRLLDGSFQKDYREMERLRMESGYAS
jgi:energy-coupling factor transporter ATP-binding protein EcfA2